MVMVCFFIIFEFFCIDKDVWFEVLEFEKEDVVNLFLYYVVDGK